ncbi:MAG: HDOD domain-containing protein [Planctomycetes bacterium]|nr:HDOD domain-containing protein [Planctomycetota bacterium]
MRPTTVSDVDIPEAARTWIEERLSADVDLPALPEAAARVIALCDDGEADARAVEGALERDPALATRVLKTANSALYGASEPVVSLRRAVSRLGLSSVRSLALSASLQSRIFDVPGRASTVQEVWAHCSVAGLYAREIARSMRKNVEAAFLCGLIHDVGRPIVLNAALRMPRDRGELTAEQLEHVVDRHHARLGARLAASWGLGPWAVAAVEHHHDCELAEPYEDEARVTRLADLFAHWALAAGSAADDAPHADPVVIALNLYPDDVDALVARREIVLRAAEAFR